MDHAVQLVLQLVLLVVLVLVLLDNSYLVKAVYFHVLLLVLHIQLNNQQTYVFAMLTTFSLSMLITIYLANAMYPWDIYKRLILLHKLFLVVLLTLLLMPTATVLVNHHNLELVILTMLQLKVNLYFVYLDVLIN